MGQDQRDAVSVFRPYMNEVNADAVELGLELIGRVQCGASCARQSNSSAQYASKRRK